MSEEEVREWVRKKRERELKEKEANKERKLHNPQEYKRVNQHKLLLDYLKGRLDDE